MNIHPHSLARHLRVGWRQLVSDPGYAAIVVVGLAVAIAMAVLASAFVRDKLWTDAALPGADRLISFEWRVRGPGGKQTEWFDSVPAGALAQGLKDSKAPVEALARAYQVQVGLRVGARAAQVQALLSDPALAEIFPLKPLAGDLKAALNNPEGLALTVAGAERLFGDSQAALGKQVQVYGLGPEGAYKISLTVQALLPTPSRNSMLGDYELVAGFGSPPAKSAEEQMRSWWWGNASLFARLAPGATATELAERAQAMHDAQPLPPQMPADFLAGGGKAAYFRATLFSDYGWQGAGSPQRRLQMLSFGVAAFAALLLAAINFVNLSSVRTLRRQREVGLRKSLGASASQLLVQFLCEALLVAVLAGALGLLLAWWAAPVFESLMQHHFDTALLGPATVAGTFVLCLLLGLLTGAPLAGIAMRLPCAASLAGRQHSEGRAGRWLRRALTLLQFAAAAALAALACTVLWQNEHAGSRDLGIQVEDRLAFDLPFGRGPAEQPALLQRLKQLPGVQAVTSSRDVPGRNFSSNFSEFSGPKGPVSVRVGNEIGPGFFDFYGARLLAGRLSTDHLAETDKALVLERSAALALGFASPQDAIGQTLKGGQFNESRDRQVVAVVEDIHLESTREAHQPTLFEPTSKPLNAISLRTSDAAATRAALKPLLQQWVDDETIEVMTVAQQLARQYAEDRRLGWLIATAAGVALLMACIGIYALATYTLRLRTREIVLRKLHGAGHRAVLLLLMRDFGAVVAAGCLLGLPIAWWVGHLYLGQFVARAPLGLWPLVFAAGLLAVLTTLATARQLRAAFALRPSLALQ
ncbi:FtsX-like permease family protein [Paucibacter sp. JuS9]|uniref:FtsX-like permease family protein n=1 Tax=Paucibacter sp. JuS9 TaxID=3228748 RepID=UPI0037565EEA